MEAANAVDVAERDQWIADLDTLMTDIQSWAEAAGWDVRRKLIDREESGLGEFQAPALTLGRPGDRIYAVPTARHILGGDGRVDLEAFPGITRLAIVRRKGKWQLRTDQGVVWPKPWSKQTLAEVLDALAKAD